MALLEAFEVFCPENAGIKQYYFDEIFLDTEMSGL
jgi:hypothetical protein